MNNKTPYEQSKEDAIKAIKDGRVDCASRWETFIVELSYPRLEWKIKRIAVWLSDVRAADSMLIEFDFDRNGYSIKMDKMKYFDNWDLPELLIEDEEIAFIPANNAIYE